MLRRNFLQTVMAGAAMAPLQAAKPTGLRLGFDSYSIRAFKWRDIQLLDYAAGLKLDAIQLSSLDDYASLEPAHLQQVREHAERVGIKIDAGTGCICPESSAYKAAQGDPKENILKGLKVAKAVGATAMRCYMGTRDDRRTPETLERCMDATIKVFRSVKSEAQDLGVKIALENHAGDMQAREVRTIIEGAGKDFVGSCLDTGNPMWVAENPMVTLEILGPYVLLTHVRDSAVFETPRGAAAQWVAMGDGVVDFPAFLESYRNVAPNAPIHLEIITGRPPDPLPYLEQDYWKRFPHTPASEFSRFVDLAKHGHPFMGSMVIEDSAGKKPAEYTAALREQQRVDLERSLEYCKRSLGIGVRWQSA